MKVSEKIQVVSHIETLRAIPVGSTRLFELRGPDYGSFHSAKFMLKKKGLLFEFTRKGDRLSVTRLSDNTMS